MEGLADFTHRRIGSALSEEVQSGGAEEKAANADEASSVNAGGPESAAAMSQRLAKEQAMRAKAMTAATVGWVKESLSETKLNMVLNNMSLVPMICILFTFCRLRAMVDLETEPQHWAKNAMVVCTIALYIQILTCILPAFPEKEGATGWSFAKIWAYTLALTDAGAMFCLFFGIVAIIAGIYTLKFQEDKAAAYGDAVLSGDTNVTPNP